MIKNTIVLIFCFAFILNPLSGMDKTDLTAKTFSLFPLKPSFANLKFMAVEQAYSGKKREASFANLKFMAVEADWEKKLASTNTREILVLPRRIKQEGWSLKKMTQNILLPMKETHAILKPQPEFNNEEIKLGLLKICTGLDELKQAADDPTAERNSISVSNFLDTVFLLENAAKQLHPKVPCTNLFMDCLDTFKKIADTKSNKELEEIYKQLEEKLRTLFVNTREELSTTLINLKDKKLVEKRNAPITETLNEDEELDRLVTETLNEDEELDRLATETLKEFEEDLRTVRESSNLDTSTNKSPKVTKQLNIVTHKTEKKSEEDYPLLYGKKRKKSLACWRGKNGNSIDSIERLHLALKYFAYEKKTIYEQCHQQARYFELNEVQKNKVADFFNLNNIKPTEDNRFTAKQKEALIQAEKILGSVQVSLLLNKLNELLKEFKILEQIASPLEKKILQPKERVTLLVNYRDSFDKFKLEAQKLNTMKKNPQMGTAQQLIIDQHVSIYAPSELQNNQNNKNNNKNNNKKKKKKKR